MVVGLLLGALVASGNVIAAPSGIDQPPADAAGFPVVRLLLILAPVSAILLLRFRWSTLATAPPRPSVFPPELSFGLVALMLLLGAIGASVALKAFGIEMPRDGTAGLREQAVLALGAYAGQAAVLALYVSFLRARRRFAPSPAAVDTRPSLPRAIGVGALALLVVWPLVNAAGWLSATVVARLGGPAPREIAHDTLQLLVESTYDGWFVLLIALVSVAAPVLEELLYRGLLQDGLRRLGVRPWAAIVISSLGFAAMHWDNTAPHAVVGLFVLSLGFGWAYERTGRLAASIAMHMLFNIANLGLALAFG